MKYLLILFILFIMACKKDFLESKDTGTLNLQTYVNSLPTMEKFVNGIKLLLQRDFNRSPTASYGDLVADDIKPDMASGSVLLAQYSWSQKANTDNFFPVSEESVGVNGEWISSYALIRSINFVIEEIDQYRAENPDKADLLKGQVYAFRAMIYFKLANIFSQTYTFTESATHLSIPYITTSDITASYMRNTAAEVYDNLISDLKSAIKLMKPGISDTKEMNQDAAKALLARTYLFKEDFENAKKTALEVTQAHRLMTISQGYPEKLYYNLDISETESLYQLKPVQSLSPAFIVNRFSGGDYQGWRITFRPTQDIIDLITESPTDIRNKWVTNDGSNWLITKYPISVAMINTFVPTADYFHTLFRSSEMFLTVAESAYKTNDENTAREYLNAIRKRADPSIPPVVAAGTALLDSIYKERRKELSFEGGRMFDIQRWHQKIERKDPSVPTAASLPYPSNRAIAPIPIQDVNIAGLEQNKDY